MENLKVIKLTLSIFALMCVFTISSLGQNNNGHAHDAHKDHSNHSDHDNITHAAIIQKNQAQKVLETYLEIKDALVKTDGKAASTKASQLVELLKDTDDELSKKIKFDAKHIADTKDISHQRDHFDTLSQNIYALVKATHPNDMPLYKQYCPMALNNQGAFWLASEKEINNPYFGDRMLHCGSVKETID
jgi:hypothetical protein